MQGLLIEAEENERAVNHGHSEGDGGGVAFPGRYWVQSSHRPPRPSKRVKKPLRIMRCSWFMANFNAQRILFAAEHLGEGKGGLGGLRRAAQDARQWLQHCSSDRGYCPPKTTCRLPPTDAAPARGFIASEGLTGG